jgi:hypothetical protein
LIAFLSPTKSLIKQHKKYIASHSEVSVRAYTGECSKTVVTQGSQGRGDSSDPGKEGGECVVEDTAVEKEEKVNIMSWGSDMWRQEADEVTLQGTITLAIYLSHCLSVCLSISLSIYMSICLSICLCTTTFSSYKLSIMH